MKYNRVVRICEQCNAMRHATVVCTLQTTDAWSRLPGSPFTVILPIYDIVAPYSYIVLKPNVASRKQLLIRKALSRSSLYYFPSQHPPIVLLSIYVYVVDTG